MKMQILAAVSSDLVPGNRNGVKASANRMAMRTAASRRLFGRSSDSSRSRIAERSVMARFPRSISLRLHHRVESLWPPHQHGNHQSDRRDQRDLRREKGDVVRQETDEQGADEAALDRAEPA